MDSATAKVEEIYCAALEIESADERRAFLNSACAGDVRLRAAVEDLISDCPRVDRFFGDGCPAADLVKAVAEAPDFRALMGSIQPTDAEAGKHIGSYKLLQKLGEGGCGTVYMAEQEFPVRRNVALKIIKLGMDTKNVIARFEAERQALALMAHPNIAHVLDAGATETGRPYFVMELVRGTKITTYCDENRLDPRQRLELFIQVCQAVQHAHQKGIIHRDIKPSNILVTLHDGIPVPKVIDFGIAKATSGQLLTDKTLFTNCDQFVGTPAYMSPEQAEYSGLDVDTRSDIYSLGVLLYEILTGRTPFDQKELLQSGFDEMRRTLREREPHRPSTKLDGLHEEELTQTAIRRHVEPRRLKSLLSGDLDWVVMKALEKDRSRRYQTANGFTMDIQRYLHNEPVVARPPSRLYRIGKLIRRNRIAFAAVGAVSLALIAGFGTSTWLFFREREAHREQLRLRNEAEARAKIAQAAVLLSREKFQEADSLVEKIQIPVTEPSLEAASVFRRLGLWHVQHNRLKPAAERFSKLLEANQVDKTDMTDDATRDLLYAGPALIASGNTNGYRELVRKTIARFAGTTDPVAAEQVIKVSLILPPDEGIVRALEPLAKVVEASVANPGSKPNLYMTGWRCFAVMLFAYREGDFQKAEAWARKGLELPEKTATRITLTRIIHAGATSRLNDQETAAAELRKVWESLSSNPLLNPNGEVKLGADVPGFWHDWLTVEVLLNEIAADVGNGDQAMAGAMVRERPDLPLMRQGLPRKAP